MALVRDLRNRWPHYTSDWVDAFVAGRKIISPTVFIFLASLLPAIAFGQQISDITNGSFGIAQVLIVTALSGIIQAILGGQPLLIIGVAEPIVVMYGFMFELMKGYDNSAFVPFCAFVCLWAGLFCCFLALVNATDLIRYFTRFTGEVFGALIAVLFMQQAVVGAISEFGATSHPAVNGLWGVLTLVGLPLSIFALQMINQTHLISRSVRTFLADYAPLIMMLVWTALSALPPAYSLSGIPQRVSVEPPWQPGGGVENWTSTVAGMGKLPSHLRAVAVGPAIAIAILFYFDHTVSSQLAQTGTDIRVARPPAYAWDLFLLGLLTIACGLVGLPPVNGVIPQAPMHSRALRGLRREFPDGIDVLEQRASNLGQSLLVMITVFAYSAISLIPTSVLWGYFAFLSLWSLKGSDLAVRVSLLMLEPSYRATAVEGSLLVGISFAVIVKFTLLQLLFVSSLWALTYFGGTVSLGFPILLALLLPFRMFAMPAIFDPGHLEKLDPLEIAAPRQCETSATAAASLVEMSMHPATAE